MTKYNFEICFVCGYPTTDFERVNGGEPWCGLCLSESYQPSEEEMDAVFAFMNHEWTSEELEEMYQDHLAKEG
jgi:hypothetical protein